MGCRYASGMASKRQIFVGGVPIGGGAPVVVQTMTKTETANLAATMEQIRTVADAGADIVRVAVPRDDDVEALKTIVRESPIPVIADIHFNHTLALKAIDAGAHCIRLNPGNIGGREKVAEVAERATAAGRADADRGQLGLAAQAPARARAREPGRGAGRRRGRVRRADGEPATSRTSRSRSSRPTCPTRSPPTGLLAEKIPYPLHLGITEAGTKWSGSLKSSVGLGTLLADGIGDTIRISSRPSTPRRRSRSPGRSSRRSSCASAGPVLIACPTCGRLQFDMDAVVAEIEQRLERYAEPIEVAVLGCAVNGIGEASHADLANA